MQENAIIITQELVKSLKEDDAEAFDLLFKQYAKRLFFFSLGYLKSKVAAEEIVQEVFYKVWEKRKTLNPALSFQAYIFKIAYHQILEVFRKIAQEQSFRHEIISQSFDFDNNLEERADYHSLLELVETIVDRLPSRQREIFIKRKQLGHSVKEIADALEIAPKTVENHITEALKTLKKELLKENQAGLLFFCLFVKY